MNDDPAAWKVRFEPKEGKPIKVDRQLNFVRFTACGRYLLAAGHDGLVRRFDATGDELSELKPLVGHHGWVQRLVIPSQKNPHAEPIETVISVDSWGQLRCGSFVDEKIEPRWVQATAHEGWILDVILSPSGGMVATCGIDRAVRVWSAVDGKKLHEFSNSDSEVLCLQFTPDETGIVAGDLQGRVRQWDGAIGEVVREFDASKLHKSDRLQEVGGVRRMIFSPDGRQLLCAGSKPKVGGNVQGIPTVIVLDWQTGQVQKELELGNDGDVYVTDLAFHPAGFLMVTTSGNPGTGKLIFTRIEDASPFFETTKMPNCQSLALHPDLQRLAVVATNGNSNGNGRQLDPDGNYPGNHSPIYVWKLPAGT